MSILVIRDLTISQLITFGGGQIASTITFYISSLCFYENGLLGGIFGDAYLHTGIFNDKKRQILLNDVCFIGAISGILAIGFNTTLQSITTSKHESLMIF
jgi:hypothetical protein